jgi:signal peptidase II
MTALLLGLILVPVVDQGVKLLVLTRLGTGSLSLGVLGCVRLVRSQTWMRRGARAMTPSAMWVVWSVAAVGSAVVSALEPAFGWAFGLLVGGALSHALETSMRGSVCDYVCLRCWPAFNLADLSLTLGALGVLIELGTAG